MLRASLKQITILFTLLLFCSEVGAFTVGDYVYTILDAEAKTVSIAAKSTSLMAIVIGDEVTYEGVTYKITEVAQSGFSGCCQTYSQSSISIGKNIISIRRTAFEGCKFGSVVIPASVSTIETSAFKNCTSLRTVTFDAASELTTIGVNAFEGCIRLHTIILPQTLGTLSSGLFTGCTDLTSLTIPASVSSVASDVFKNKTGTITITFEGASAPTLTSILGIAKANVSINVLSTAAKASFEANSNWLNSANAITVVPLAVSETVDNSVVLEHHKTHTADVNLTRTIRHEGYNALCLPFALGAEQVTSVFGAGCDIEELTSASISETGIDLTFTNCTALEAGKPYLVKPTATVENPSFRNVVITNEVASTSLTDVDFVGVFSQTQMTANENILLLGPESTLFPTGDGILNGLRGYFVLKTSKAQAAAKKQARVVINSGGETGLEGVAHTETAIKQIINGQLVITREGVQYNACGARVGGER